MRFHFLNHWGHGIFCPLHLLVRPKDRIVNVIVFNFEMIAEWRDADE